MRDEAGKEIARSRMVFRDPYKRPYGLQLLVNTQIPSGESRAHKVPIGISNGTIECELHFKHYFPIEDNHPDLARRLEATRLPFANLTPNLTAVVTEPEIKVATPEGISAREASVADLVDFARPPIGKTEIDIPKAARPLTSNSSSACSCFQCRKPIARPSTRSPKSGRQRFHI